MAPCGTCQRNLALVEIDGADAAVGRLHDAAAPARVRRRLPLPELRSPPRRVAERSSRRARARAAQHRALEVRQVRGARGARHEAERGRGDVSDAT